MNQQHNEDALKGKYDQIMALFGLADQLIMKAQTAENPEQYVTEVEPLVDAVVDTADSLSEEFFVVIDGHKTSKKSSKTKIEGALRKSYTALQSFTKNASQTTRKHAAKLLQKLKYQLENVIANIVDFVALSLERVMQKQEIEEIKQRQVRVAQMLHQTAMQQAAS